MKKFIVIWISICPFLTWNTLKSQEEKSLNLLPYPNKIVLQKGEFVSGENIAYSFPDAKGDSSLSIAVARFFSNVSQLTGKKFTGHPVKNSKEHPTLEIMISRSPDKSSREIRIPNKKEGYQLIITGNHITLKASARNGILYGLETLKQLASVNKAGKIVFPALTIEDSPRFAWRGLMIDVSRHFIPIEVIKRNLDAMVAAKMNVLHLHLSDNEGFRIQSEAFPLLQEKGSQGHFFTKKQMKEIIAYASDRGIMVVPEFDMPGHTKSWFAGYPELASAPGPYEPGSPYDLKNVKDKNPMALMQLMNTTPFPTIDPSKESTYAFLDRFIGEMAELFPSPYLHIGADENNGVAWKINPEIAAFMKSQGFTQPHELQAYFVERVRQLAAKHGKQVIGWEELFDDHVNREITVHVWQNGKNTALALAHGNKILISKGFYLDLFMPAYIHYTNPDIPTNLPDSLSAGILGGEAAQWTEIADQKNLETRIWPRAGAVAERLWSDVERKDVDDLYRRLFLFSKQLNMLGIKHMVEYHESVAQLAGSYADPVYTLTDVLSPVKGYKNLISRMMANTSSPLSLREVSDILFVDSETKWEFRKAVSSYLLHKDEVSEKYIMQKLQTWAGNDEKLKSHFADTSAIGRVIPLSVNLSEAAGIGLEAIKLLKEKRTGDDVWKSNSLEKLKSMNKPCAQTELDILLEIESLVRQEMVPLPASYSMF